MLGSDEPIDDECLALFDRLAELTRDPDAAFTDLTAACAADDRVRRPEIPSGPPNPFSPVRLRLDCMVAACCTP